MSTEPPFTPPPKDDELTESNTQSGNPYQSPELQPIPVLRTRTTRTSVVVDRYDNLDLTASSNVDQWSLRGKIKGWGKYYFLAGTHTEQITEILPGLFFASCPRPNNFAGFLTKMTQENRQLGIIVCCVEDHEFQKNGGPVMEGRKIDQHYRFPYGALNPQFAKDYEYDRLPIVDTTVEVTVEALYEKVNNIICRLDQGQSALVHCKDGMGRSGIVTWCTVLAKGIPATDDMPAIPHPTPLEAVSYIASLRPQISRKEHHFAKAYEFYKHLQVQRRAQPVNFEEKLKVIIDHLKLNMKNQKHLDFWKQQSHDGSKIPARILKIMQLLNPYIQQYGDAFVVKFPEDRRDSVKIFDDIIKEMSEIIHDKSTISRSRKLLMTHLSTLLDSPLAITTNQKNIEFLLKDVGALEPNNNRPSKR